MLGRRLRRFAGFSRLVRVGCSAHRDSPHCAWPVHVMSREAPIKNDRQRGPIVSASS
jgi:hypothetical protein